MTVPFLPLVILSNWQVLHLLPACRTLSYETQKPFLRADSNTSRPESFRTWGTGKKLHAFGYDVSANYYLVSKQRISSKIKNVFCLLHSHVLFTATVLLAPEEAMPCSLRRVLIKRDLTPVAMVHRGPQGKHAKNLEPVLTLKKTQRRQSFHNFPLDKAWEVLRTVVRSNYLDLQFLPLLPLSVTLIVRRVLRDQVLCVKSTWPCCTAATSKYRTQHNRWTNKQTVKESFVWVIKYNIQVTLQGALWVTVQQNGESQFHFFYFFP